MDEIIKTARNQGKLDFIEQLLILIGVEQDKIKKDIGTEVDVALDYERGKATVSKVGSKKNDT